ncbi:MAG: helix-turn-helix domain-containing protein [Eubacteriales bacterium]
MVDLKLIIASNLIKLRTEAGMTQSDLGEKLNYSDKSVSKWERAESLPDANVLKQLSEIFGVSVDYLLNTHDEWEPTGGREETKNDAVSSGTEKEKKCNFKAITAIAVMGVWTAALFLFVLLWMILDARYWIIFAAALPVSIITHLVLNSIWNKGKFNRLIVLALTFSIVLLIYISLAAYNPWQLFLLLIPVAAIIYLTTKIRRKR